MSTTAHTLQGPGVRSTRAPLVTLGWQHFTLLMVVLLLLCAPLILILLVPFITR
jgi:hypothetical protein